MEEKPLDMTKGFDDVKGDNPKEKVDPKVEEAKIAADLVANIINMLSTGQIEVEVLRPRRKESFARTGMLIGIRSDFHTHTMWATVAYGAGFDKRIDGKKVFVPYSDSYPMSHIRPIKLVKLEQKSKDNG